jgi:nickel transport protein
VFTYISDKVILSLLLFALVGLFGTNLFGHGVNTTVLTKGIGIEARYSDSSPLSDSEVTVFSPSNDKDPFLKGITDKYGRFMFIPDTKGTWTISVDDGMGHKKEKKITVSESFEAQVSDNGSFSTMQLVVMALSVIWGLTGTALYFRKR